MAQYGVANDPRGKPFPELTNNCIIRAAYGEQTDYTPVWIMRQAGRYLPEFRELRQKYSFFELVESPELACKVTLMPIKKFDLDAAIIFSDILVIPQALGMTVEMLPGEGPHFPQPLKTEERDLKEVLDKDVDIAQRLSYVYKAITLTRHRLNGKCPLIGFSGAPWTLMCYMVEGGGSKTYSNAKKWLYQKPEDSGQLLELLTIKVADHLVEQAKAGAQLLQLFESNAEYLNLEMFETHAFPYILEVCQRVKDRLKSLNIVNVPLIVFAKGAHYALDLLGNNKKTFEVLGLDWTMDPVRARASTELSLQGNLDPCAMYTDPARISVMVREMIQKFGTQKYIANLGHGIYPDADVDCVRAMVDSVHEISRELSDKE